MEDSFLSCEICDENYNSDHLPRNLPCGHTLCTDCLHKVLIQDKKCPECREMLPAKNASNFPINYPVLRLASFIQKESKTGATTTAQEGQPTDSCQSPNALEVYKTKYSKNITKDLSEAEYMLKKVKDDDILVKNRMKEIEKEIKMLQDTIIKLQNEGKSLKPKEADLSLKQTELEELANAMTHSQELLRQASSTNDMSTVIEVVRDYKVGFDKFKLKWPTEEAIVTQQAAKKIHPPMYTDKKTAITTTLTTGGSVYGTQSANGKSRWAHVKLEKGRLLLYSLQDGSPPSEGMILPYDTLRGLAPKASLTVFMEIGCNGFSKGHILTRMFGDTPRSRQTTFLCTGEKGPSYRNTLFYGIDHWPDGSLKLIRGGDYENNNGTGGRAIVDGITSGGVYTKTVVPGLLVSWPANQQWRLGSFDFYLSEFCEVKDFSAHGIVTEGLNILNAIAGVTPVSSSYVADCGLVLNL